MNAIKEVTNPESPVSERTGTDVPVVSTRGLGLSRWVQYVFVIVAALVLWLTDKLITQIWQNWGEPSDVLVTVISAAVGVGTALVLYRNPKANRLVTDVVGELSKVTWPSRKETYASTVIVIVTSIIAAAIVGSFDFVWSAITDLLYKYKV